jgi:hypothetical protein
MNDLCKCHRVAKRRCDCGAPLCKTCFTKYHACRKCIEALDSSTDESDALQLAQWEASIKGERE